MPILDLTVLEPASDEYSIEALDCARTRDGRDGIIDIRKLSEYPGKKVSD
jgi:hypothetical protein